MMPTVKRGLNRSIFVIDFLHCSRQKEPDFMPNYGVKSLFY